MNAVPAHSTFAKNACIASPEVESPSVEAAAHQVAHSIVVAKSVAARRGRWRQASTVSAARSATVPQMIPSGTMWEDIVEVRETTASWSIVPILS
jgi:hypothetical protein